ncbi:MULTISPECIES: hypothetical protein [Alteromonadaceae]|jgi:uncharacterized protein YacL|uniref:Holin of 3TMs, for gene-transfer release n=1 Tax=Brumicola blandensis TaxID=3075611 RepID=A0AAW8R378_9ALTE|nr:MULTISPECIES: hypothetical protein [unclassified Alteromonas]MDT0583751.1 hypothetical protein [Alteromonas sp. W409]MDT0629124.1 hypothetical protein [Alteromonas sp. W364]
MGWLSRIFSSTGVDVVASVGKAVDDLITSDEELALTEIQKQKVTTAYKVRMQEILMEVDQRALEYEENLERSLTERHKIDMKSDSWLSKNIRPMTLIFMTLVVTLLAFSTIFTSSFTAEQNETIKAWIPFFQTIMLTIYGFYFGSRGLEKIQKIRASKNEPSRLKGLISAVDQEPKG